MLWALCAKWQSVDCGLQTAGTRLFCVPTWCIKAGLQSVRLQKSSPSSHREQPRRPLYPGALAPNRACTHSCLYVAPELSGFPVLWELSALDNRLNIYIYSASETACDGDAAETSLVFEIARLFQTPQIVSNATGCRPRSSITVMRDSACRAVAKELHVWKNCNVSDTIIRDLSS